MRDMTNDEYRTFMSTGTYTGKLATSGANNAPHVVPVWFVLDGDAPVFMTGETTIKARYIRQNPNVALCVDLQAPPYSFAMVRGKAEILAPTPEELLDWSTRIARRYMGADLAEQYGKRNAVPGELLVKIHPEKIVAIKDMAD